MIARIQNVKLITLSGAFIMSLGLFLASYSTKVGSRSIKKNTDFITSSQLWHLYLTQSILYGIGSSMYYFPIMSLTPLYFDRHRGFAMGFILAGSGVGGLVFAPVLRSLLDRVGIQWTLRILGIWNLVVGLPVGCVVRQRSSFGARVANSSTRANMTLMTKGTFLLQVYLPDISRSLCTDLNIFSLFAVIGCFPPSIGKCRTVVLYDYILNLRTFLVEFYW